MSPSGILPSPLPAHPRLFASDRDWDELRTRIKEDPFSGKVWRFLERKAGEFLAVPPLARTMKGTRLLTVARLSLARISILAAAARVTGEERYADRAVREMLAVCAFSDWNPGHFLDVAEMSCGVAIGFDWLYDRIGAGDRETIIAALRDKGLRPSFEAPKANLWWINNHANWNQVCHAGLSVAAIAIAETESELAEKILRRALENIPYAAGSYAPDGVYVEGSGYWGYGTAFHVVLASALERLTGDTHGLDRFPGFVESAEYLRQVTSPRGEFYNYSDSGTFRPFEDPLLWFARRFGRSELARHEVENIDAYLDGHERTGNAQDYRILALTLLWRSPAAPAGRPPEHSLHWLGRGPNPVAAFRSAWDDPRALFAAAKGGSPSAPHGHMDAGSFILEADGVRWAVDLGGQDYLALETAGVGLWDGRQEGGRWKIFRLGPEGHNILRFNGALQNVGARAEVAQAGAGGDPSSFVITLDDIYRPLVKSARRELAPVPDGVLIRDEWSAGETDLTATWQMLTRANPRIEEGKIILDENGETLTLRPEASGPLRIEIQETSTLTRPYDAPNPNLHRICLHVATGAGASGFFRVLAVPGSRSAGVARGT